VTARRARREIANSTKRREDSKQRTSLAAFRPTTSNIRMRFMISAGNSAYPAALPWNSTTAARNSVPSLTKVDTLLIALTARLMR